LLDDMKIIDFGQSRKFITHSVMPIVQYCG